MMYINKQVLLRTLFIPLFIQTAGSLAAGSQPGHILMYALRLSSLAACLHPE